MKRKLKTLLAVALCAVGLSAMDAKADTPLEPEISAVSDEGWLDLTVGDRVAKDVETIVVDPAWGGASEAWVKLQNGWQRTYNCASNDLWDTTALTPGRYSLAFRAGAGAATVIYGANFWKTGADWTVFDGANIEANTTFEQGKTYLILGTDTVADGVTLTVTDGAKFAYGAGAGFLGGTIDELPKRYEQKTVEGDLYQIVEKIKGSEDNPWGVGEGVTAYTNGTELVIGGAGTVAGLADVDGLADLLAGLTAINVASNGVTGVASDAFQGVGGGEIALTLPDGWQGELPDEEGNWYGATGVTLTAVPLAVKNVKFQQRYPWNGKVDIGFGVTGPEGETNVVITAYTNGTVKIATFTATVTIPEDGILTTNLVWDVAAAGLGDDFKSDDVTVEVAFAGDAASTIFAKSAAGTLDLRTSVALAAGERTVSGVTWSATAWGATPAATYTELGFTNKTTGATGLIATGLDREGAADVSLPKKDGEYAFTHSAGDLTSFVTFTVSGYPLGCEGNPWEIGANAAADVVAFTDGTGTVFFKPARGTVTKAGLETITNAMGGASFTAKLIAADGSVTNDLMMVLGASGTVYDTLGEALAADEASYTLFDVKGCIVNYDGMGRSGTMATDMFIPGVPTNLTANAFTAFGYEFQGWATNDDEVVVFADAAEIADPKSGDVYNLKAVWKLAPVSVGEGVTAYLGTNGTLYVEGEGAMKDFTAGDPAPWTDVANDIVSIDIGEGVTRVGNAAFANRLIAGSGTVTLRNPDFELNLLSLVSADGAQTNEIAVSSFRVCTAPAPAEPEEAAAFFFTDESIDDEMIYEALTDMLKAGVVNARLLTLGGTIAVCKNWLVDMAGETPYSSAMERLLELSNQLLDLAPSFDFLTICYSFTSSEIFYLAEHDKSHEIPGTEISWRVLDGVLYVNGEGELPDFVAPDYPDGAPWDDMYWFDIESAVIDAGITRVGAASFAVCPEFGTSEVLFKDPAAAINLAAFMDEAGTVTNIPTVKVEIEAEDGRTLRVAPGGWTDADDPSTTYETLEDAIVGGATSVVAAFTVKTDEGDVELLPKEAEEVVKSVPDPDTGIATELTAKFVNDANGLDAAENVGLAADVEGIASSVETLNSNIVVTVKLESAGPMDEALSNACETAKADSAPDAATLGFAAHNFDIDVAWAFAGAGGELTELPSSIITHIPMTVYDGLIYSVSRIHGGAFESLPEWTDATVDSETAEWFRVDVAKQEIVIKMRLFCPYAIGVLELEKTCSVVVGDGDKLVGDPDPTGLATNFTLAVTGPINVSDFAGYAKRTAGEAAGDYPINFVCVRMPEDFSSAAFTVVQGLFTIEDIAAPHNATGTVVYAKASKVIYTVAGKDYVLKHTKPATWKAKAALGCTFAGWSWIGTGAEPSGFKKLSVNERRNPKLKFKVGKKENIHPKDFAASWVRIDEDMIDSVAFTTNAAGLVAELAVETYSYVKATVKGLPKGMKFNAKKLKVTGKPTKNGTFTTSVTVKNASGYSWSGKFKIKVAGKKVVDINLVKEARVGVPLMLWCDTAMGSVKGCGVFKAKSTRTVSATAKKGYVFAGWFMDPGFSEPAVFKGGVDYRTAKQKLVVKGPTYLFARFLPKTTKADPIMWLRYEGAGYCGAPAGFTDETDTWYQGVKLPTNGVQIAFGSASLPTVKVTGLPKGVKFDAKKLRFTGVPTKAGTFTVKVSVKNKSGATDLLVRKVKVVALPKWAVGTFDGYHMEGGVTNGTLTATVSSVGKLSGKTTGWIAPTTFKASYFADVFTEDGSNLIYRVNAAVSYKDPKTKKTVKETDALYLMENPNTGLGMIGGGDTEGNGCVGVQRGWGRKELAFPAFDTVALKDPLALGNGLKLKFGAKGVVTVSGKVNGAKVSGTAYVLPVAWHSTMMPVLFAELPIYVAPTKSLKTGFCEVYNVLLMVGESGKFNDVAVSLD